MESVNSSRVFVKPNIDNVLPYQQFIKSATPFPSHILPILFAGGRNLTLKIKDSGHIAQEQLYNYISPDTIGEVDFNVPHSTFDGSGIDCDFFVLDIGVIVWFNDFGYGINLTSRNIFYHGITELDSPGSLRQGYSVCLSLDREQDADLLNLLIGDCRLFDLQLEQSTVTANYEFDEHLYLNFTFVPKFGEFDRHYNAVPESLFFYEWFGINRGNKLVNNIYNAVESCLEKVDYDLSKENGTSGGNNAEASNSRQNSYSTVDFFDEIHQQDVLKSLNRGLADDL